MARTPVIVFSLVVFGVAFSLAGVGVETAGAICDRTHSCFEYDEPGDDPVTCTYEAVLQGVTVLMECYASTNDEPYAEMAVAAAAQRVPVSANALIRVSINISRNAWHDEPNNYTVYFDRAAEHVEWRGEDRFEGSLGLNESDHRHHETSFQIRGAAPPARLFVRFVYWDDTVSEAHEGGLVIDVAQSRQGPPAPGVGVVLVAVAVALVAVGSHLWAGRTRGR